MTSLRSNRSNPAMGTAIATLGWACWALVIQPSWTAILLLLSPVVLAPLALRLTGRSVPGGDGPALARLIQLAPWVAAPAAASFGIDEGAIAAMLTVPWLVLTFAVAALGAGRFVSRRRLDATVGFDAGMAFLAVGGSWLMISRLGANPLGFDDTIVLLTAVHFHYAGLILPIVGSVVARRLDRSALVPTLVIVGVPLTAAGITVGGTLEWIAATTMALAGLGVATQLALLGHRCFGTAKVPLTVAALALAAGMTLAIAWAWSIRFGWDLIGIEAMARTHGSLNALGFGVFALLGLHLLDGPVPDPPQRTLLRWWRPDVDDLGQLIEEPGATADAGLLQQAVPPAGFRRDTWRLEVADFAAARAGLRSWRAHRAGGLTIAPPDAPVEVGSSVAYGIPFGPVTATAVCRIIEVVDEPMRTGFVYATCEHHHEAGVLSWIATRHPDGTAAVEVTGVWRPAALIARVGPVTRWLQDRAIRRMLAGLDVGAPTATTVAGR